MALTNGPIPADLIPEPPLSDGAVATLGGADHAGEWPPELSQEVVRFEVHDAGAAEWCMRKLAAVERERAEVRRQAAEWRFPIDKWEAEQLAATDRSVAFFTHHLERYALEHRQATGKPTVKLPSGTIRTRGPADGNLGQVVVEDEDLVLLWAKSHYDPELWEDPEAREAISKVRDSIVKVTEKVLLTGLRGEVEVVAVPTGRHVAVLGCGCEVIMSGLVGDERMLECPEHDVVSVVSLTPERQPVPMVGDKLVPGCTVEPPSVSATVVPAL